MSSAECVQVIIRCRPLSSTEKKNNNNKIVQMGLKTGTVSVSHPNAQDEPPKTFTFDMVFDDTTEQQSFYDGTATRIVNSCIDGYNGTVFAYGQTGTGKTFSMEGGKTKELRGVIPRAFEQIFAHIQCSEGVEFLVRASFIEIYNEDVFDLLSGKERKKLELKEDPDNGVYVKDLSWFVVKDIEQCDTILQEGKSCRQVGATAMNADSSRSHCIFTLKIETSEVREETGEAHIKVGKLNMVDLAGSERQGKTGATGERLKEATKINLSLSALGNVISALTSKKRSGHIPYRDSKLTRLLQDSLGGNTKTVMIAAIGPADYNFDETISTLRFANRAKSIKNKPKINEDPKDAMLREYQEEIARLKQALEADGDIDPALLAALARGPPGGGGGGGGGGAGGKGKRVIEKVVVRHEEKGVKKEVLLALEEQSAEKKKAMEEKAAKEKEELLREKEEAEQRARDAGQQLEQTQAEKEEKIRQKELLAQKLKEIEATLLQGSQIVDKASKQRIKMKKKEAELRKKQMESERIKRELEERKEVEVELQEKYDSQEKELAAKTKKLDKLRMKYQEIKTEIEDVQAENQREREELLETIRELTRQIELKRIIIENFVPYAVGHKMESRAFWDEDKDQWLLEEIDPAREHAAIPQPGSAKPNQPRPISEFARIKAALGDQNPRFKSENIIQLELDMPERTTQDYQDLQSQIQDQYAQDQYGHQEQFGVQEQYGHQDQMYMEDDPRMHGYDQGNYDDQMMQDQMYQEQLRRQNLMGGAGGAAPGYGGMQDMYYGQYNDSGDFSDPMGGDRPRTARRI